MFNFGSKKWEFSEAGNWLVFYGLGANRHKLDWAKTIDFLARNADQPVSKGHKTILSKLLADDALSYSELIEHLIDASNLKSQKR